MENKDKAGVSSVYETIFQSAGEGMLLVNRAGTIELANPRALQMFGYEKEELIGKSIEALVPERVRHHHHHLRESYAQHPKQRPMGIGMDLKGQRKDGTTFPVEVSLNYIEQPDGLQVVAFLTDITKRREHEGLIRSLNADLEKRVSERTRELRASQLLFSAISRNFPNGTINVFDRDFNYVFVEGEELYRHGITSEKLMGLNYLDRLPKEVRPRMKAHLDDALEGRNSNFELELSNRHYLISTVGLQNDEGKIDRILLVEQNITRQKLAEARALTALEKEKRLNELKSRFVAMASHEFRTPLSTIVSSLALARKYDERGDVEKKEKHFNRIKSSARHLTNILNDFLSLDKLEAGKVNLQPEHVKVKHLIEETMEELVEMSVKGLKIDFQYTGLPELYSDAGALKIIFANLLGNAFKYSRENSTVGCYVNVAGHGMEAVISDEGLGIPKEEQHHLFERFYRATNVTNIQGTGLGLNIVKRYLDMLDGDINFTSEFEKGTTFTILVPALNMKN